MPTLEELVAKRKKEISDDPNFFKGYASATTTPIIQPEDQYDEEFDLILQGMSPAQAQKTVHDREVVEEFKKQTPDSRAGFWEAAARDIDEKLVFSPVGPIRAGQLFNAARRSSHPDPAKAYADPRSRESFAPEDELEKLVMATAGVPLPPGVGYKVLNVEDAKKQDLTMITRWAEEQARREKQGYNVLGYVGAGLSGSLPWMVEFAMTGGIKQLGSVTAKKWMRSMVKRHITTHTAGIVGGAVARSALGMPHRTAQAILMRRVAEDPENWSTSVMKGYGSVLFSVFAEEAGGMLMSGLSKGLSKSKFGKKLIDDLYTAWKEVKPKGTVAQFVNRLTTQAGYNGILGEVGEERLETILNAAANIDNFGADEAKQEETGDPNAKAGMLERIAAGLKQDYDSWEKPTGELITIAVPGSGRFAIGAVADHLAKVQTKKEMDRLLSLSDEELGKELFDAAEQPEDGRDIPVGEEAGAEEAVQEEVVQEVAEEGAAKQAVTEFENVRKNKGSIALTGYHGTNKEFAEFDVTKAGESTGEGWLGNGIYFSPHEDVAPAYGKHTKKAIVTLINPFIFPEDVNPIKFVKEHGGPTEFTKWVKDQGYDGIISDRVLHQVVAFDTSQIALDEAPTPAAKVEPTPPIQEEAPPPKAPVADDTIVNPNLHVGNMPTSARNLWAEELDTDPEAIKDTGAKTVVPMAARTARKVRSSLEKSIEGRLKPLGHIYRTQDGKNIHIKGDELSFDERNRRQLNHIGTYTGVRTQADVDAINRDWQDVVQLRRVLGEEKQAKPFSVFYSKKHKVVQIDKAKPRIKAAIEGLKDQKAAFSLTEMGRAAARGSRFGWNAGMVELRRMRDEIKARRKEAKDLFDELYHVVRILPPKLQSKLMPELRKAAKSEKKETINRNLEASIAKVEKALRESRHKDSVKRLSKTWKKLKSKYKRGSTTFGAMPQKYREKFLDLMHDVDLDKLSEAEEKNLRSLKHYVQRLTSGIAANIGEFNDDAAALMELPQNRINELNRLSQTSVQDMTADDIDTITRELNRLAHQLATKESLIYIRTIRPLKTAVGKMIGKIFTAKRATKDLTAEGVSKDYSKAIKRNYLAQILGVDSSHIDTLVETIFKDSPEAMDLLMNDLQEGWTSRGDVIREAVEHIEEGAKKIGFTYANFKALKDTIDIVVGGKTLTVSYDQLLSMYMLSKSGDNIDRVLGTIGLEMNGKNAPTFESPQEWFAALDKLSDKQKAFADLYHEVNRTITAPALNETSNPLEGYDIATDPFYWSVHRVLEKTGLRGRTLNIPVEGFKRFQERTGGNQRIRIIPFTQDLINNIQEDATYHGMAIPMRNARSVINSLIKSEEVKKAGHTEEFRALIKILSHVQKYSTDSSIVDMLGQKYLNTFSKSVLGLRMGTALAQYGSFPAAFSEVNPKYFSNPVASTPSRIAKIMDGSSMFWERWKGHKVNVELGNIMAHHAAASYIFGKTPILEKPLRALVKGDQAAIGVIHAAIEKETEATTDLKPGTKEFDQHVIERLEYVVRRTQPMWDTLNRSALSSNPSTFVRSILMFRSAREKQWNILLRANNKLVQNEFNEEARNQAALSYGGVGSASFLIASMKWGIRTAAAAGAAAALTAIGIKDEEDPVPEKGSVTERLLLDTGKNLVSLAPGGGLAGKLISDSIKVARGADRLEYLEPFDNPILDVANTSVRVALKLVQGSRQLALDEEYLSGPRKGQKKYIDTYVDAAREGADQVAKILGIPYSGPQYEWYYPIERQLSAIEEYHNSLEYKSLRMSSKELITKFKSTYYQTSGRRSDGTRWSKGQIKPNKRDDYELLREELLRRGIQPQR